MNIQECSENWNELGKNDPMWVVLTAPDKAGGKWEASDFFESGRKTVEEVLFFIPDSTRQELLAKRGAAFDFGCGLGRLSQALGAHFSKVDGVDISQSMIDGANGLNTSADHVKFHLNTSQKLPAFADSSFDFLISCIALQHTPSRFQVSYLEEFIRILKPGGLAYLEFLHAKSWRQWAPESLVELLRKRRHQGKAYIPMYPISAQKIKSTISGCNADIIVEKSRDLEPPYQNRHRYGRYLIQKR